MATGQGVQAAVSAAVAAAFDQRVQCADPPPVACRVVRRGRSEVTASRVTPQPLAAGGGLVRGLADGLEACVEYPVWLTAPPQPVVLAQQPWLGLGPAPSPAVVGVAVPTTPRPQARTLTPPDNPMGIVADGDVVWCGLPGGKGRPLPRWHLTRQRTSRTGSGNWRRRRGAIAVGS